MPKPNKNINADGIDTSLHYRAIPLKIAADGKPDTLDEATRSVQVVAATEAAVPTIDWDRYEMVPEILLMSGCQIPASGQVVLLDTHRRYDTSSVIGSVRELKVVGDQLVGRAFYSTAPEAEGPYLKMTEGHLTDYSAGYRYDKKDSTFVEEGQTLILNGRTFTGPVKVVSKWTIKETSACPIGADDMAKARAATAHEIPQKEKPMNEAIRKFLESRGLSASATEEEAQRFLETLEVRAIVQTPATDVPAAMTEESVRAAVLAEQDRIEEIRAIGARSGLGEDEIRAAIKERKTIEDVRKVALEKVLTAAPAATGYRAPLEMGADERDKFRAAAQDGLLLRSGSIIEKAAPGAADLMGFTLRELARESLRVSGISAPGNALEMIGRALTTSDFPAILANVANKSLFEGYTQAEETWPIWAAVGTATDFKTTTVARAGEMSDLDEIPEEGEYKYGTRADGKEEFKLATFGKLFAISRQTIINDDLGALTDIPFAHGEAWKRKVGDVVYAVLTANSAMGDGTALFHANHGNLATAAVLAETSIAEAIKLMKLQKDIGGKRRLNINPQFVIAPVALEGAAEVFFNSGQFAGANAAATRSNPYAGSRFTRVFESRLDDASATAWYVAGAKGKTVKVFFLNGQQGPYLETKQGWNVDGVEFKVRGDAAAKAIDWKAMVKNAGA